MKKLLLLTIAFGWAFVVRGQSREEIKELLTNSYNYMANGSFVLEDTYRIKSDGDITRWGDEGRYFLYNGIFMWETLRAFDHLWRITTAAPPAFGSWWWQSEKDTPEKAIKDTILFMPSSDNSWLTMVYNMLLQKRFDSAQYTLSETEVNGVECYTLTAKYPELSQAMNRVPLNHLAAYDEVEVFLDERFKGFDAPPVLTEDEWYFPEEFIAENLEKLRTMYFGAIAVTFAKDSEHPAIYRIVYYRENGRISYGEGSNRVIPLAKPAPAFDALEEATVKPNELKNLALGFSMYSHPESEVEQEQEPEIVHPVTVARYIHLLYILMAVIIAAIIIQQVVKRLKNRKSA